MRSHISLLVVATLSLACGSGGPAEKPPPIGALVAQPAPDVQEAALSAAEEVEAEPVKSGSASQTVDEGPLIQAFAALGLPVSGVLLPRDDTSLFVDGPAGVPDHKAAYANLDALEERGFRTFYKYILGFEFKVHVGEGWEISKMSGDGRTYLNAARWEMLPLDVPAPWAEAVSVDEALQSKFSCGPWQGQRLVLEADGTATYGIIPAGASTGTWKRSGHRITLELEENGTTETVDLTIRELQRGTPADAEYQTLFADISSDGRSQWQDCSPRRSSQAGQGGAVRIEIMDGSAGPEAVETVGSIVGRAMNLVASESEFLVRGDTANTPRDHIQVLHTRFGKSVASKLVAFLERDLPGSRVSMSAWEEASSSVVVVVGGSVEAP